MVVCLLQAAAVCKCSSCTSAGDSHRFPPPSLPKPVLAFAGLVHTRTARAISRRRFAYQNGVEFRPRLCDWTHNGLFQKEVLPRLGARRPAGTS